MTPKTVIVAIDAPDVVDRFVVALTGAGHRAIGAGSPQELLDVLDSRSTGIDLVVLDAGMEADGRRVVEKVRRLAPGVPAVAFSRSIRDARDVRTLADLGVESYVDEHIAVDRILPSLAPLLSPGSFDRRTSARRTVDVPAALAFDGALVLVSTLNVGSCGMAVRTMSSPDAGADVTVRFRLPRSPRTIEVAARVVWNDRQSVLGLQFENVDPLDQAAIDEFVDRSASDAG